MFSLLLLAICSFVLSFLLTPLCRNLAVSLGFVDRPDAVRKLHRGPIPRVGGVAIFLAVAGAYGVLLLAQSGGAKVLSHGLPFVFKVLPAVGMIFLTGLADDLIGLKPWQKLAGEMAAAALVCWSGVLVSTVGGHHVIGWWAYPLTVLWLILCTNALNLIDGMDGLASGVGLFAAVTTFLAGLMTGQYKLQMATAPVIGALLAFLRFNFNPASVFLGDCGSLTLGFILGCSGIVWSQKSSTILGMTAPLIALSIPLLDTGLAIVRRMLRGQPIFSADRQHIHHRLLDRGLTPRRAALLLYGLCGIAASLALLQSTLRNHYAGLVIVIFCISAWIGVQHLGYVEFNLAGRLARPQIFCRVINEQLRLRALEGDLAHAATAEECWKVVCDAAHDLGFSHVSMRLDHTLIQQTGKVSLPDAWVLRVPLSSHEFVNLARGFDNPMAPMIIAPLAELLRRTLTPKLPLFAAAAGSQPAPVKHDIGRAVSVGAR